jgi:membrane protease YdiL (CAAX protease family)
MSLRREAALASIEPGWRHPTWVRHVLVLLALTLAWQLIRLQQVDAESWLICDYAGRILILAWLASDRTLRGIVYRRERVRESYALPINGILYFLPLLLISTGLGEAASHLLGDHRLGTIPRPTGWLRALDLTCGIALVAVHEELVFRRLARHLMQPLGDGWLSLVLSAVLFGAFHWWAGTTVVVKAMIYGVALMLIYRRGGVLWPCVAIHYCADLWALW